MVTMMTTDSKSTPATPIPTGLTLHRASRTLEIGFDDGQTFLLPFELLRVYSPKCAATVPARKCCRPANAM